MDSPFADPSNPIHDQAYMADRLKEARKMADELRRKRTEEAEKSSRAKPIIIGVTGQENDPVRSLDVM